MTWAKRIVRPSLAMLLLAGAAAIVGNNPMLNYLLAFGVVAAASAVVWFGLELASRARVGLIRSLGWTGFALQAVAAGLLYYGQQTLAIQISSGVGLLYGPSPSLASLAVFGSGYVSLAGLVPILPAAILVVFQPKRIKPKEIEAAFT